MIRSYTKKESLVGFPGRPVNRERRQASPRETRELKNNLARHRVLVVDDNVDAAKSLGMLLELSGQEVLDCLRWA